MNVKKRYACVAAAVAIVLIVGLVWMRVLGRMSSRVAHYVSYASRPLWDSKEASGFRVIPFYPPGGGTATSIDGGTTSMDGSSTSAATTGNNSTTPTDNGAPVRAAELCVLHGWTPRQSPARVVDVVIFSVELDLLELRLRELGVAANLVVVAESSHSFTGRRKDLLFAKHRMRFSFAEHRIKYLAVEGRELAKGEDPFNIEAEMRGAVTRFLHTLDLLEGDRVIMSDVDEIPSREAIELIRWCDNVPEKLHLRMRNFVYSFDYQQDAEHWRAKVVTVPKSPHLLAYTHKKESDVILSDAGWHCSWCFPKISDFIFKMTSYSHADRVWSDHLLDPKHIQKAVCDGTDVFEYLPEAYSFADLASKWGPLKRRDSAVGVPRYLIETAARGDNRFAYLLPGGCQREG